MGWCVWCGELSNHLQLCEVDQVGTSPRRGLSLTALPWARCPRRGSNSPPPPRGSVPSERPLRGPPVAATAPTANGQPPTTAARTALGRGVVRGRRRGREIGGAAFPIGGSACSSLLALRPLVLSPSPPTAEPMSTPRPSPAWRWELSITVPPPSITQASPRPARAGGGAFSTSESGR